MVNTIDMQTLRYLKLFMQVTRIQTRYCFAYNNMIVFSVPKPMLSKAVGREGANVKRISSILKKRVRIVASPNGEEDIKKFIEAIVSPVTFNELEVKDNEVILTAGSQTKAALIGRNKRRLLEMKKIIKDYFRKEFKIA
jgi:NusA-like KH domain protein